METLLLRLVISASNLIFLPTDRIASAAAAPHFVNLTPCPIRKGIHGMWHAQVAKLSVIIGRTVPDGRRAVVEVERAEALKLESA